MKHLLWLIWISIGHRTARFPVISVQFKDMQKPAFIITTIAMIVLGALLNPKAHADIDTCDDLAALEADPMAQSAPVDFEDLHAHSVISTCLAALNGPLLKNRIKEDLDLEARLFLQLGRGYLAAGDTNNAWAHFNTSADLDYPAGYFALGVFYLVGEDGEQDLKAAHVALNHALDGGVIWAAKALSMLHLQDDTEFYAPEKAAYYQSLWAAR